MRTRRGVSSIELALVLPVLLAILLGLVDWSWFMVQYLDVGVAVTRGARIAAGDATDPNTLAAEAVCDSLEAYRLTCDPSAVQVESTSDASGPSITVAYSMPFTPPVGLVPTPHQVRGTATTAWYGYLY